MSDKLEQFAKVIYDDVEDAYLVVTTLKGKPVRTRLSYKKFTDAQAKMLHTNRVKAINTSDWDRWRPY